MHLGWYNISNLIYAFGLVKYSHVLGDGSNTLNELTQETISNLEKLKPQELYLGMTDNASQHLSFLCVLSVIFITPTILCAPLLFHLNLIHLNPNLPQRLPVLNIQRPLNARPQPHPFNFFIGIFIFFQL